MCKGNNWSHLRPFEIICCHSSHEVTKLAIPWTCNSCYPFFVELWDCFSKLSLFDRLQKYSNYITWPCSVVRNINVILEIFLLQHTNQPIWVLQSECISVVPNESLFFFDKSSVPGWIMLRKYQLSHFSLFITHKEWLFFVYDLEWRSKSSLHKKVLKFLNFAKNRKIPTLKCIPRYIIHTMKLVQNLNFLRNLCKSNSKRLNPTTMYTYYTSA